MIRNVVARKSRDRIIVGLRDLVAYSTFNRLASATIKAQSAQVKSADSTETAPVRRSQSVLGPLADDGEQAASSRSEDCSRGPERIFHASHRKFLVPTVP